MLPALCPASPGDSCSPEVRLSAQPSSLTVHLSRNHSVVKEYADHAKYKVYYGLEGEPLKVRNSARLPHAGPNQQPEDESVDRKINVLNVT